MLFNSIQWVHPSTTVVAGPSNSGKTTLISKILQHKNQLFTSSQKLKTIITANYRDQSQIGYLSRQAFPGTIFFLISVYNYILSSIPYGYIVLDFSQNIHSMVFQR